MIMVVTMLAVVMVYRGQGGGAHVAVHFHWLGLDEWHSKCLAEGIGDPNGLGVGTTTAAVGGFAALDDWADSRFPLVVGHRGESDTEVGNRAMNFRYNYNT